MAWDTEGAGDTEEEGGHGDDAAVVVADADVDAVDVAYVACVDEDVAAVVGVDAGVDVAMDEE